MAIPAIEVQLPPLHTLQREVADSPARFRVLCCGRRWGKTRLAIIIAMREMLENAGAVLWVAPSHDKTNIGWRIAQKTGQADTASVYPRIRKAHRSTQRRMDTIPLGGQSGRVAR